VSCYERFRVLSCIALIAWLIPSPAHAERCDARCAAYVQAEVNLWKQAQQTTLARQWLAWSVALTPHSVCVIDHESRYAGLWTAVNEPGHNYGAYQFDPRTWDAVALRRNRPDLVGVRPDFAPWWEQVSQYAELYAERGDQPWGNRCVD
jgi:hypothetical protein